MKFPALLGLLLVLGTVLATPTLSVNGRQVPGLTLSLVDGVSYAPASSFAEALGARMRIDYGSGQVSLELGSRILVLPAFEQPTEAPDGGVTWQLNGETRPGRAAMFDEGQLYLPVSAVAKAFLGYTTYVPERERVMVVLPRGELSELAWQRQGRADRIVLTVVGNVPYALYHNEPVDTLEIRFERTDAGRISPLEGGRHFRRVSTLATQSAAEVRISLEESSQFSVYTVPVGRGYRLVVDLFEEASRAETEAEPAPRVVIDAAHGGDDRGISSAGTAESTQALQLSRLLAEELQRLGFAVELTRNGDHALPLASRSGMGVGSDLFLSIHVHPSQDDLMSIYYLAEADGAASLELAIRQNAESEMERTTDALRRRLLLNLIPDVDVGRRYAQAFRSELFGRGHPVAEPRAAPLAVLAGAAGRGLVLELPAGEVVDERLVSALADVINVLLPSAEASR